ncbi:MAG: hypothetical protein QNK05_11990 [Myxococcota bacterium]|nr:hypothetical protein [Myxococcota bacterium]
MKHRNPTLTLALLLAALLFAFACGGQDDPMAEAKEAAEEAAAAANEAASKAAEAAGAAAEAAGQAASEAIDEAEAAAAAAGEAASEAAGEAAAAVEGALSDPVAKCLKLASEQAWAEALEACTKAHEEKPDDMAIEHALQQAKAAAE